MGKVIKPFVYVPVKSQGPHYLERRFRAIREQQKQETEAKAVKVTPIKRASK